MERNIRLLAYHNFFTDFVFFAPVAIIYFAKVTGSYTLGMSIFSAAYVSSAFFEVPTGIISDRIGRKKTIIAGSIASILCMTFYALAHSWILLFIGSLFQGVSRAFYSGNNDALLHDTLRKLHKDHEYHTYLGKTSSLFQVALALASVSGSILAALSFPLVLWISVLPQIAACIIALQIREPEKDSPSETTLLRHTFGSVKNIRNNTTLLFLSAASILRFSLGESAYFLRSAFVNSLWPLWAVGISNTLSHISGALSFYFSGKAINKFGPFKILTFEIISNRIINFTALLFPTIASPALMGATSLTYGMSSVAINSLQQKEFTQSQRATMRSIISFIENVVFGICSLLLGFLADATSPATALIIIQVLYFVPLWFYRKAFTSKT